MEEKNLSECEELVIRAIWSSAEPLTMQEITEKGKPAIWPQLVGQDRVSLFAPHCT